MPKIIAGPVITILTAKLLSITFAHEDRGAPPVPTLIQQTTYELLDDKGQVYQIKTVGQVVTDRAVTIEGWLTQDQAAITLAEGL